MLVARSDDDEMDLVSMPVPVTAVAWDGDERAESLHAVGVDTAAADDGDDPDPPLVAISGPISSSTLPPAVSDNSIVQAAAGVADGAGSSSCSPSNERYAAASVSGRAPSSPVVVRLPAAPRRWYHTFD